MKRPGQVAIVVITFALFISLYGCSREYLFSGDETDSSSGTPVSLSRLSGFSRLKYKALLLVTQDMPFRPSITYGADLYRLIYWTLDISGEPVRVSGLLTLPRKNINPKGFTVLLHGTNPDRSDAPSAPNLYEGILGSLVFSSAGYILLAPDYPGLGESFSYHPYLHASSAARATVDMIKAVHTALPEFSPELVLPEKLFLMGYSQGGQAAMAAGKWMEEHPEYCGTPTGAAGISGPYILANEKDDPDTVYSFENALYGSQWSHTLYLAYLGFAYCMIYDQPLESIFTETWAERIPVYFGGYKSADQIRDLFTAVYLGERFISIKPIELFNEYFISHYEFYRETGHDPPWLIQRLGENRTNIWQPGIPVRLYYSETDTDVVPTESLRAAETMGPNVSLHSVGSLPHDESILHSIEPVLRWFDQF